VIDLPPLPEGRVLPVVTAPAAVLSTPSVEVDPTDPEVAQLAADLLATQRVSPGCVGLAAPQVGVGWRVFSLDVTRHPKARTVHGEYVMVNPRIVSASRNEKGREGCMSVPDLTGDVKRATRIVVEGFLPGSGEKVLVETDAFEARALQHEIDHLDGALFLDRVAGPHALHARKVYLAPGELPGQGDGSPLR
jgi:peptide deformylase